MGYETRIEAAVRSFKNHASIFEEKPKYADRTNFPADIKRDCGQDLAVPDVGSDCITSSGLPI